MQTKITVEELLANGWKKNIDEDMYPIEKAIENRNPLNNDADSEIKLTVHGMYNQPTFAVVLPSGGLLNFNPETIEDLNNFERMLNFYDPPF